MADVDINESDPIQLPLESDDLLINLDENKSAIKRFLADLKQFYAVKSADADESTLGSALRIAYEIIKSYGGQVTVLQTCLPNKGLGSLNESIESETTQVTIFFCFNIYFDLML